MTSVAFHATACEHLSLALTKLRALVALRLREMQHTGLLPPPEEISPGTHIYVQEVEARLRVDSRTPMSAGAEYDALESALDGLDGFMERHGDTVLPLVALKRRFALSESEYLLLLLAIAPHFDPGFPRLFAFIQNHFERQYPTMALWMELFAASEDPVHHRHLIDPGGPLFVHRLLRLHPIRPHLPPIYQPLVVDERLIRFIEGDQRPGKPLEACVRLLEAPDKTEAPLWIPDAERVAWQTLVAKVAQTSASAWMMPWVGLSGLSGIGRKRRALALATEVDKPLLAVDLIALADTGVELEEGLKLCRREATLQGAALCFEGWGRLIDRSTDSDTPSASITDAENQHRRAQQALGEALAGWTGLVFFVLDGDEGVLPRPLDRTLAIHSAQMPEPSTAERLWDRALPEDKRADDLDLEALSTSFRLTPGRIEASAHQAQQSASGPVGHSAVIDAIKAGVDHHLGAMARRVDQAYTWSDLILSDDVMVQMREIIGRFKHRGRVLQEWGLGRRFGQDLGLSVLFEGPPGTGKTMSASLIARELGLDLYQIDLSRIVSRYVGETEKNLGRIFDEAERAHAMLLFDEADSLFGARTEIKSANDRYANLEVNFLLQRIERFSGVAILTTNFSASIDDAFARRLSARVSFPKPEADERRRLWQSMLSDERLPQSPIDCSVLAEAFELTGGYIRNAILRGAFIAASRGRTLDQETLQLAARLEMKEQGMLVQGSPHRELSLGDW